MADEKIWEGGSRRRIAIVGGDTLLAREIRELLQETKPAPSIELISGASENASVLALNVKSDDEEEALAYESSFRREA